MKTAVFMLIVAILFGLSSVAFCLTGVWASEKEFSSNCVDTGLILFVLSLFTFVGAAFWADMGRRW